ncbi:hypothetical protein Acr_18g0002510 [Actinidia rufa]|uniref:Myosin heavy chain-like protein n=1 Tax=Actinidia rufa TaxID=165716 RepID=A0A7J0G5L8_9ERIC|nr:hypothetical protein Acr_18g0002510 [Actinidia rufa]
MNRIRANSSPDLFPSSMENKHHDDSSLEGVAATVKLLLKLIQDHKESCAKEQNDSRRMLRVAGMMTILDNIRTRIQKCQSFGKKGEKELRRCNTDLQSPSHVPRDKKAPTEPIDEKEKLRRELSASLAARKSLECMCSSLGKEKEIMANELARKVHELGGMEELVNDLKAQNETLLGKVQEYAQEHREKKLEDIVPANASNLALQDRNKALSEQLLRSLDGHRSKNRKLKEAQEKNANLYAMMEEIKTEVGVSLERIRGFKQRVGEEKVDVEEEISELEHMFECFEIKVSKKWSREMGMCQDNRGDCCL